MSLLTACYASNVGLVSPLLLASSNSGLPLNHVEQAIVAITPIDATAALSALTQHSSELDRTEKYWALAALYADPTVTDEETLSSLIEVIFESDSLADSLRFYFGEIRNGSMRSLRANSEQILELFGRLPYQDRQLIRQIIFYYQSPSSSLAPLDTQEKATRNQPVIDKNSMIWAVMRVMYEGTLPPTPLSLFRPSLDELKRKYLLTIACMAPWVSYLLVSEGWWIWPHAVAPTLLLGITMAMTDAFDRHTRAEKTINHRVQTRVRATQEKALREKDQPKSS